VSPTGRPRRRALAAAALSFLFTWTAASAATIYVSTATCPATGSGSPASPYCRIQDAICVGVAGDLVSVAPGTYTEAIRMKPGVSVISQGGAAATTINAAGKPCTDTAFCTKRTGTQCSVVTFASGHTPTTVLDGFTLTGGAGQTTTIPANVIGGGGVYIFSSPTLRNNIIQNNVILQVSPARGEFSGAGIYVSKGAPIITNNVITGNRAVPPPGTSTAETYGYGGGIYSSFVSAPTITDNTIQGNRAGDPNIAFSIGAGGGIAVTEGDPNAPAQPTVIDRNLIADNIADTNGGGVSVISLPASVRQTIVSNNVIVGNSTYRGGGLYTYLNDNKSVNNTFVGNTAQQGGGVFSGLSDVTLPTVISNDLITGNFLSFAGTGGGIYKLDFGTTPSTTLEADDVFGNQKTQVDGDINDATFFTTNGNITLNPSYVNEASRDYHVNPNSPVIDRAYASRAPAIDKDDTLRGYDGNGVPNSPQPGDNDIGAYEWRPPCVPSTEICNGLDDDCDSQIDEGNPGGGLSCSTGASGVCSAGTTNCAGGGIVCNQNVQASPEVCDGLDNNCNGSTDEGNPGGGGACTRGQPGVCSAGTRVCQSGALACVQNAQATAEVCDGLDNNCNGAVDEGFPDTDGDGLANCVDPDIDNDGAMNASDCAPADPSAWGAPVEVANVRAAGSSPTTITYDLQNIGPGTHYEIVSGLLSRTAATRGFEEDFCVAAATAGGSWQDSRPAPPAKNGWYYMIRDVNVCGASGYGTPLRSTTRSIGVCANGIQDADADGSPSDLDCNDSDPAISPLKTEICDGLDNNCSGTADEGNPGGGVVCGVSNIGDCRMGTTMCTGGAIACSGAVFPGTETCDGHDNNCNGAVDEGYPDTDGDALADCVDPDIDNDGAPNASDCAPLDVTAFGVPTEIATISIQPGAPPQLAWTNETIGSGTRYQIATGEISPTGHVSFPAGTCLPSVTSSPAPLGPVPPLKSAYYYMVRPVNACGAATYGSPAKDTHPDCP